MTCQDCKIEKDDIDFPVSHKRNNGTEVRNKRCRECKKLRCRLWLQDSIQKTYQQNGGRKCAKCCSVLDPSFFWKSSLVCKDCIKKNPSQSPEYIQKYYQEKEKLRRQRPEVKTKLQAQKRRWRMARTPEQKLKDYTYGLAHSRRYAPIRRIRICQRKQEDLNLRLSCRLRASFAMFVRHEYKSCSSLVLLGCTLAFFKKWIALQFQDNMFWYNWGHGAGKWNLEHIIPVALFDLTSTEEQKKCFHYTNFRPMWHTDNAKKSDKLKESLRAREVKHLSWSDRMKLAQDIIKRKVS